jgi:hypothetical protein
MHVLRWQGQFHRRFAISPDGAQDEARAALDGLGLGFCRRGADPVEGYEYYSWWNEDTARYFPQSFQLPSLAHIGQTTVFNAVNGQLNQTRGHLLAGTSTGAYPYLVGRMGWGHPWGVAYGGMTGGAEIHIVDGVETAELGAVQGWQLLRAVHRMQTDRMPSTLYDLDGEPSSVEDWLRNAGSPTAYVPFLHFMLPTLESDDPFGVNEAPRFQIDYVAAMGLVPSYEGLHFQFDPHDLQHLVRYTRTAKALVWLANDQLASDDLRMQAENFHFSYHRWYNASGGYAQSTGLRWDRDFVDTHPGKAFEFGRGEAWGLDCMNAAYATSDPAWRTRKRPWFDDVLQLLADGQAACTGFLQAEVITQFLNGNYRARQGIEQPITENAILGMLEAVYRGEDAGRAALGRDVLRDSTLALISPNAWSNGQSAPWTHSAIGPTNPSLQIFCNASQIPPDGFSTAHENFQLWPSLAYGYEETGNGTFLSKGAMASGGGASLLNNLESGGLNNMPNKAPLLALAQRLNGQL